MASSIFKKTDALWVEKYRPQNLSEYIADSDFKEKFQDIINKKELPNLLLYGSAGGGKSSLGNLMITNFDCDVLYINASAENGIDTVRTKITDFCVGSSFYPIKVLFLEEMDFFSSAGWAAFRPILELYSKNVRVIITCNDVSEVIDPIRSRCQEFNVLPPTKEKVIARCEYILTKENVNYEKEELTQIVVQIYPDVRKIINILQQYTINNTLKLSKDFWQILTFKLKIIEVLNSITANNLIVKVTEIRQLLADSKLKKFNELFRFLYDSIEEYQRKSDNIITIIFILAKGQLNDSQLVDKEINMVTTLIELAELLTK